jgi:4-oxalocrotonate tautomerase
VPYVNIRLTPGGATAPQKAAIIKGVTTLLQDILKTNPALTFVIIDEVDPDNWGVSGETVTVRKKRRG